MARPMRRPPSCRLAPADPRLRVVTHDENHGLVASLNEGLALCRGELVARLDADDSSSPTRLARQVAVFRTRPQVVLCASAYDRVDPSGTSDPSWRAAANPCRSLRWRCSRATRALHSTVMFRRDAVRDIGGYRDSWFPVEDYDLWLRLLEVGEFEALTTSETTYMAERSDSISSRWSDDQGEQAWRRSQRYFEELVGERPSDVGKYRLRVRDVSAARRARAAATSRAAGHPDDRTRSPGPHRRQLDVARAIHGAQSSDDPRRRPEARDQGRAPPH